MSDPNQSWKRASGDAFELFISEYYNNLLNKHKVRLIPLLGKKDGISALQLLGIYGSVGNSKLDIAIMEHCDLEQQSLLENGKIIGGIHAKVSLAERVTDDVPTSRAMMKGGYISYLVTLDVKSFPLSHTVSKHRAYINKGELGTPEMPTDKRNYIERHDDFTACYAYNLRTVPSPSSTPSGSKIFVCNLDSTWDDLCDAIVDVVGKN